MRIDVNRIVQMPQLRESLDYADERCRKVFSVLDELKKHGIESAVFFAGDVWGARIGTEEDEHIFLIKTKLPEVKFAEFFNAQKKSNKYLELNVSTLAGHTVYMAKYAPAYNASASEPFLTTYLAEDVIAVIPYTDKTEAILTGVKQGGSNLLVNTIDRKSLCAALGKNISRKEKLRTFSAKINLTGAGNEDIEAEIVLGYKNAKSAMRKSMEIQFLLPGFAGLIFSGDQKLLDEVVSCLQIMPVQEKIFIKCKLTKTFQDKVSAYLSSRQTLFDFMKNDRVSGN